MPMYGQKKAIIKGTATSKPTPKKPVAPAKPSAKIGKKATKSMKKMGGMY